MGANVYGEIASEHLNFNEKTLWTGGPSESRKDYMGGNSTEKGQDGASLKNIQKLFAEGKTSEATAACNNLLVGISNGYGAYQPWGDIREIWILRQQSRLFRSKKTVHSTQENFL